MKSESGPLLNIEHSERKVDATHADMNTGRFFKKILVREISEVPQWDAKKDVAEILEDSIHHKLDVHLKRKIRSKSFINDAWQLCQNFDQRSR